MANQTIETAPKAKESKSEFKQSWMNAKLTFRANMKGARPFKCVDKPNKTESIFWQRADKATITPAAHWNNIKDI